MNETQDFRSPSPQDPNWQPYSSGSSGMNAGSYRSADTTPFSMSEEESRFLDESSYLSSSPMRPNPMNRTYDGSPMQPNPMNRTVDTTPFSMSEEESRFLDESSYLASSPMRPNPMNRTYDGSPQQQNVVNRTYDGSPMQPNAMNRTYDGPPVQPNAMNRTFETGNAPVPECITPESRSFVMPGPPMPRGQMSGPFQVHGPIDINYVDSFQGEDNQPAQAMNRTYEQPAQAINRTFDQPAQAMNRTFDQPIQAMNTTFDQPIQAMNTTFDQPIQVMNTTYEQPIQAANATYEMIEAPPQDSNYSSDSRYSSYRDSYGSSMGQSGRFGGISMGQPSSRFSGSSMGQSPGRLTPSIGYRSGPITTTPLHRRDRPMERLQGRRVPQRILKQGLGAGRDLPSNLYSRTSTRSPFPFSPLVADRSLLNESWMDLEEEIHGIMNEELDSLEVKTHDQQFEFYKRFYEKSYCKFFLFDHFTAGVKTLVFEYNPQISLRDYGPGAILILLQKCFRRLMCQWNEAERNYLAANQRIQNMTIEDEVFEEPVNRSIEEAVSGYRTRLDSATERAVSAREQVASLQTQLAQALARIEELERGEKLKTTMDVVDSVKEESLLNDTRNMTQESETSYKEELERQLRSRTALCNSLKEELTVSKNTNERLWESLREEKRCSAVLEANLISSMEESAHKSQVLSTVSDELVETFEKSLAQSMASMSIGMNESRATVEAWKNELQVAINEKETSLNKLDRELAEILLKETDLQNKLREKKDIVCGLELSCEAIEEVCKKVRAEIELKEMEIDDLNDYNIDIQWEIQRTEEELKQKVKRLTLLRNELSKVSGDLLSFEKISIASGGRSGRSYGSRVATTLDNKVAELGRIFGQIDVPRFRSLSPIPFNLSTHRRIVTFSRLGAPMFVQQKRGKTSIFKNKSKNDSMDLKVNVHQSTSGEHVKCDMELIEGSPTELPKYSTPKPFAPSPRFSGTTPRGSPLRRDETSILNPNDYYTPAASIRRGAAPSPQFSGTPPRVSPLRFDETSTLSTNDYPMPATSTPKGAAPSPRFSGTPLRYSPLRQERTLVFPSSNEYSMSTPSSGFPLNKDEDSVYLSSGNYDATKSMPSRSSGSRPATPQRGMTTTPQRAPGPYTGRSRLTPSSPSSSSRPRTPFFDRLAQTQYNSPRQIRSPRNVQTR